MHRNSEELSERTYNNSNSKVKRIMFEKAGLLAGAVWTALNENGAQNAKDLKKAAKVKTDKELYIALGWLLREDKLVVAGDEKEPIFNLK